MTRNDGRDDKDIIYDSETDRDVKHRVDDRTDVVNDRTERVTEVRHVEPKKKSPLGWLLPLIALLLAVALFFAFCNNKDDDKVDETTTEETTTEEAATDETTTEEATTEDVTTEEATTEDVTTEAVTTEEATTEAS